MKMSKDEFEAVTDEAFSFLLTEFGYLAQPPESGGHFGSAMVRKFVNRNLTICFVFGDADSTPLCSIIFRDGANTDGLRHRARTLYAILEDRHPQYKHRTRHDLTHEESIAETILEYGRLLEQYGVDPIKGDFGAFPTLVYLLIYVDNNISGNYVGDPIGIFSSLELAEAALAHRHKAMKDHRSLEGYKVWRMEIDPAGFAG